MLEEHSERGARSQVVGAYRILLHREILGGEERAQDRHRGYPKHRAPTPAVVVTSPRMRHSRSLVNFILGVHNIQLRKQELQQRLELFLEYVKLYLKFSTAPSYAI